MNCGAQVVQISLHYLMIDVKKVIRVVKELYESCKRIIYLFY